MCMPYGYNSLAARKKEGLSDTTAMADRKIFGHLSQQVAAWRQPCRRPNKNPMRTAFAAALVVSDGFIARCSARDAGLSSVDNGTAEPARVVEAGRVVANLGVRHNVQAANGSASSIHPQHLAPLFPRTTSPAIMGETQKQEQHPCPTIC